MKKNAHNKIIVGPLMDRVIISAPPERDDPNKEQRVGGIIVPQTAQTGRVTEPYFDATVIAAGPDCKRVKAGYHVIVARPDIFHVEVKGSIDVYMIREPMIVAVLA